MKCSNCGGYVEWKGPLSNLTHTECAGCGGRNAQIPENDETEDDEDKEDFSVENQLTASRELLRQCKDIAQDCLDCLIPVLGGRREILEARLEALNKITL